MCADGVCVHADSVKAECGLESLLRTESRFFTGEKQITLRKSAFQSISLAFVFTTK